MTDNRHPGSGMEAAHCLQINIDMFEADSFPDPSEALKINIEMIKNLNIWKFYFLLFSYNVSASLPWSQLTILHYYDVV